MSKLDPQLEFLADDGLVQLEAIDMPSEYARYGVAMKKRKRGAADAAPAGEVDVLVQYDGDAQALVAAGLTIRSTAGDVLSGSIAVDRLAELDALAEVERIEGARALYTELDLATADTHVDDVQAGPPGYRGSGVIVGIVDSGIDYTHGSFRRADRSTRILRIWDQGLAAGGGEAAPSGFGYGVEYTAAQIDAALATADPFQSVRHRDTDSNRHGTHVSGIAAGDGSDPGQSLPAGTFAGVATEADIIVVGNVGSDTEGLGNSARALDAVSYIFQQATALSRPCVINMSLGDNLGPHDGTALLERGIDNLLGGQGRVLVKSAGNAAADRIHAQGTVGTGGSVDVRFTQPSGDATTNQMDIWYDGADTFQVTVVDPAGNTVGPVAVGATTQVTLAGGNVVRVSHRNNDPQNGDKRIFITFTPGAAGTMLAGTWTLRLASDVSASGGAFDAWIQRGTVVPQFLAPHETQDRTISTPGTATAVITAASYITRGAGVGSRSTFSSRGPTRDGRLAPTIAAPGQWIISARGHAAAGEDPYVQLAGTSMAAPHVAGAVALLLQRTPTLTTAQVAQTLRDNARTDSFTGPTPNTAWGAGKLDLLGAFRPAIPIPVSVIEPWCNVFSVAGNACLTSVVLATCRSVTTPCFSAPGNCLPSVPRTTCISVALPCPSQAANFCESVVIPCISIPRCVDPGKISSALDCPIGPQLTTLINPLTDPFRTVVFNPATGPGNLGGTAGGPRAGAAGFRGGEGDTGSDAPLGANRPSADARTVPGFDCPRAFSVPGWDCPPKTVPGWDCPQPPRTIPGVDCPLPKTVPGLDCPRTVSVPGWDCPPKTVPGVDCPLPPKTIPGVDCPLPPKTVPGVDCPAPPKTVPGWDCPQPQTVPWIDCPQPPPPSVPVWDCPQPIQTIPSMDCPTVLSVPGRDCPIWSIPGVDCGRPWFGIGGQNTFGAAAPSAGGNAPRPTEAQPNDRGFYDYDESWWE